jgi:hypothetical protein
MKARIVSAWKDKIDKDGPPSAKEGSKMEKIEFTTKQAATDALKKYSGEEVGDALSAMYLLQSLVYLYLKEAQEPQADQIDSLKAAVDGLKKFIQSELDEASEGDVTVLKADLENCLKIEAKLQERATSLETEKNAKEISAMEKAEIDKLVKAEMEKIGKTISADNLKKIQGMHDQALDLGAKCPEQKCEKCGGVMTKIDATHAMVHLPEEDLKKFEAANAELGETLKKMETVITGYKTGLDDAMKKIDTLRAENSAMGARLKVIEDLPRAKTVATHVVKKTEDDAMAKVDATPAPKTSLEGIRSVLASGGVPLVGKRQPITVEE